MFIVSFFVFFKQKTAYEMRISDWSSDVCSSDLRGGLARRIRAQAVVYREGGKAAAALGQPVVQQEREGQAVRPAGDGRGHCGARLERRQRRHGGGELRRLYRHCGEAGWTSAVAGEGGGAHGCEIGRAHV